MSKVRQLGSNRGERTPLFLFSIFRERKGNRVQSSDPTAQWLCPLQILKQFRLIDRDVTLFLTQLTFALGLLHAMRPRREELKRQSPSHKELTDQGSVHMPTVGPVL